jgi:serine/threonine protein kinase
MQQPPSEPGRVVGAIDGSALPPGHELQEFVIEGVLGIGGFGIVYRALDTRLQRAVAVKEYMPAMMAARRTDLSVTALLEREREIFDVGLRSFVNEARLLASFDHPSLVKVYRFWEGNGTAYMVMPLYHGVTLKTWIKSLAVPPSEEWLLALLRPLSQALEQLHHAQPCCLHRDVALDNVLLLDAPSDPALAGPVRPLLLDFGAARRVIGDMTQSLTVFLKPGYTPIEQYGEAHALTQGPWTDVYALSAVLYACIAGRAPVASVDRVLSDTLVPAAQIGAGRYSDSFLAAIDAGLQLRPEHRPQSMRELRQLFGEPHTAGQAVHAPTVAPPSDPLGEATQPPAASRADSPTQLVPRARRSKRALGVALAAGVLATAAGAWFALRAPPEKPATVVARSADTIARDAPKPPDAASSVVQGVVEPAARAMSPPAAPFSVMAALQDIVDRSDPQIQVTATADKRSLVIGRDRLTFRVRSSRAGHVYVFTGGTDKSHFHLLFPNRLDKANRIDAGAELALPGGRYVITAEGPAGTNHLVVLVSRHPRDLSQVGLRQTEEPIPEFDLAVAEQLWQQRGRDANPYVGVPVCPVPGCVDAFGAVLLTVQEVAADKPRR